MLALSVLLRGWCSEQRPAKTKRISTVHVCVGVRAGRGMRRGY